MLSPGDTLYVREGTYVEGVYSIPSGTAGAPATVSAAPGETVIWRSPVGTRAIEFSSDGVERGYIVINGFILEGQPGSYQPIRSYEGAYNVTIQNNEIRYSPQNGMLLDGTAIDLINNNIHHNGTPDDGYGPGYPGVYFSASHSLIEGNWLHHNEGTALNLWQSSGDRPPNTDLVVRNNIMHDNIRPRPGGVSSGGGIFFAHQYKSSARALIYNNVVYHNDSGITIGWNTHPSSDVKVYNNTVYNNGNDANMVYGGGIYMENAPNSIVRNNIVFDNGKGPQGAGDLYLGNASGSHNLTSNPGFANPSAGDFHLQSGSPARDAGMTLPEVPCDFDGNKRPGGAAYDIGAYEHGSSPATDCPKGTTGGPTPTPTAPPTPTPVPPPVITLTATPSSLSIVGQGTQLFWTVSNAESCTASGGWSGAKDPGGGTERHTPTQSTTYVLTCTGPGGTSQKSVTVTMGAAANCTRYQSGSTIPQGFGVPWDVSNPSSLLLKAECTPPTIVLKVGDNQNLTYVYKTAYVAPGGATSWSAVDLFGGTLISQAWYVGFAQGITQIQDITKASYYVGYTCRWIPPATGQAGRWKCGCRDNACTQSYWQIQRLQQ